MTSEAPQGRPGEGQGESALDAARLSPSHERIPPRTVVVLVSASWADPSRPAPTVLRELSRRWGDAVHTVLIEDPSDELLDLWQVDALPTWLRGESGPGAAVSSADERSLVLSELSGVNAHGEPVSLPGPWIFVHRLTGAQPKHVVEAEFGPKQ